MFVVIRTKDKDDSQLAIGPFPVKDEAYDWIGTRTDGEEFSYYIIKLIGKDTL